MIDPVRDPFEEIRAGEWQLVVQRSAVEGRTWVRLQFRERSRDFWLAPGDTLDLQIRDGVVLFKGHNPAPSPPVPASERIARALERIDSQLDSLWRERE